MEVFLWMATEIGPKFATKFVSFIIKKSISDREFWRESKRVILLENIIDNPLSAQKLLISIKHDIFVL